MVEGQTEVERRINWLEGQITQIQRDYPSNATVNAWFTNVHNSIETMTRELSRLYQGLEEIRKDMRAESSTRKNQVSAVLGVIVAGVVLNLLLTGLSATGGG